MINLNKSEEDLVRISLSKMNNTADQENVRGHVINLSKSIIDLSKKTDIDLGSHVARVVAVLDVSGSMESSYEDGTMQDIITRLVPMGLQFDDNGEIDVYVFDSSFKHLEGLTSSNYRDYVNNYIMCRRDIWGGTYYSGPIEDIMRSYFKRGMFGKMKNSDPVFVMFITDGDNADKSKTERVIRESSETDMFISFLGCNQAENRFSFLRKLDDLSGRKYDNTAFAYIGDIDKVTDQDLYNKVLEQYPDWLKARGLK